MRYSIVVPLIVLAGCTLHTFEKEYYSAGGSVDQTIGGLPARTSHVCPDKPYTRLYVTSASGGAWVPSPCEEKIVIAAINHCIHQTVKTANGFNILNRGEDLFNSVITVAAVGGVVAGAVYGSTPAIIGSGVTALTSVTGDAAKILPGSAPTAPSPNSLFSAAANYAQANQNAVIPADPSDGDNNPFYAGLWNAVGAACPQNLFAGGFHMTKFNDTEPATTWAQRTTTVIYIVSANDKSATPIMEGLTNALKTDTFLMPSTASSQAMAITPNETVNRITVIPCKTCSQVQFTATVIDKSGKQSSTEAVAFGYGDHATTISVVSPAPTVGDTISLTANWAVQEDGSQ